MNQDKADRYHKRIRSFIFEDELGEHFEAYCKTNEISSEDGEKMCEQALLARHTQIRKKGGRSFALGLLIIATVFTIAFMTTGMVSEMKKFVNYGLYGAVAISSIFVSSGLIQLLIPRAIKGKLIDRELE